MQIRAKAAVGSLFQGAHGGSFCCCHRANPSVKVLGSTADSLRDPASAGPSPATRWMCARLKVGEKMYKKLRIKDARFVAQDRISLL